MKTNLTLNKAKDLNSQILKFEKGKTNSTVLNRLIQKKELIIEEDTNLCILLYSNCSRIQAVYEIIDIEDENSPLKELYQNLD